MTTTLPTQEQVDRIAQELAPDVVNVTFREGRDWSDDPAVYFRVVLSDEASQLDRLGEVAKRVRQTLYEKLGLLELAHLSYIRFRNQSEQAKLRDQAWD